MELQEYQLRILIFCIVISIISLFEIFFKRRNNIIKKRKLHNLFLHLTNIVFSRLFFATAAMGVASYAQTNNLGLFNYFTLNKTFVFIISIIILDFLIYFQHLIAHKIKILWKLHSLHHSDPDYDWTTSLRFHPLEILFSLMYKSFFVILLGIPPYAIIIFEALLNSMAIFNHGNYKIPLPLDKILRFFVVTPDMHRVHHSIVPREKHSNFGFNLSIWDRFFGTYVRDPDKSYTDMTIGLNIDSKNDPQNLKAYLLWPFKFRE